MDGTRQVRVAELASGVLGFFGFANALSVRIAGCTAQLKGQWLS